MKRQIAVILITLSLGAFSWAQGTNEFFDGKKCREELEIMKGILTTAISFTTPEDTQKAISFWRGPSIDAFYLSGQGAVFVIPISSIPSYNLELSRALDATRESLNDLRNNLRFEVLEDEIILAPALPAPPAPPAPPEFPIVDQEKLKVQIEEQMALIEEYKERAEIYREEAEKQREVAERQIEEVERQQEEAERQIEEIERQQEETERQREVAERQIEEVERQREVVKRQIEEAEQRREESLKQYRERAEKRRENLLQRLADIKVHLIEALANYGDSLTTVQSDEYINLILNTENLEGGMKKRFDTISAQKSWITDYKAGRLSLEDFKQKVLHYTQ